MKRISKKTMVAAAGVLLVGCGGYAIGQTAGDEGVVALAGRIRNGAGNGDYTQGVVAGAINAGGNSPTLTALQTFQNQKIIEQNETLIAQNDEIIKQLKKIEAK